MATRSDSQGRFLGKGEGCSEAEVTSLEARFGVSLPEDYREFLRVAGRRADSLWVGSDFTLERLPGMQLAARSLLAETGLDLPDGAFVFYMHQGYVFFFISSDGVFSYQEGDSCYEKQYGCFLDFLEATAVPP